MSNNAPRRVIDMSLAKKVAKFLLAKQGDAPPSFDLVLLSLLQINQAFPGISLDTALLSAFFPKALARDRRLN